MTTTFTLITTSINAVLYLAILVSAVNCAAFDDGERPGDVVQFKDQVIYFRETESYQKKCESFKLTLKEARAVFDELKFPLLADTVHGQCTFHLFIVDDAFVFSEGSTDKRDFPVSGVHVDGNTGKIIIVPKYSAITWSQFPIAWKENLEKWEVEWAKEYMKELLPKDKSARGKNE